MPAKIRLPASSGFDALKWRCIGPSRGGRVVAVSGDPVNKMVFYFGACAGGIWKTVDGGVFWQCVSDGFMGSAAVGSIAVAPSDPNVIYAGTGETAIRLDVSYGDGLYKSTDAGRTWSNVGLKNSKFIGRICIHPQDPDLVYVAALGDVFGPNSERGVYRSRDGGKNWQKILHRSDVAGAIDLSMDRTNPRILFASMWEARRNFWNISSGGPGSGLFRSTDGGDTWQEISRNPGLPDGLLGKIGVSISPARAGRVWALVEAEGDKTGLYRSDDLGARWTQVSANRDLMHRPWYYTHVFADPGHADTVYVTNLQMWKSTDGGTSFSEITTRHGDNHDLWIDPNDPDPHDRRQRRRRPRVVQFRRFVVDDLQSEDGAVLSSRHRQPVSLSRLRHPAGQHLDLRPECCGMGRDHAGRLLLSRHRRERLHRRQPQGPQHRLCRRRRFESRRCGRAAALRSPHAPDPAGQCVARGIRRAWRRRT